MPSRRSFRFESPDETGLTSCFSSSTKPLNQLNIYFSQHIIVATLLKIVFTLVLFHLIGIVDRFILTDITIVPNRIFQLIDLNRESNFPSYFSFVLLLFSAVLLLMIAIAQQQVGDRFVRHWQALSLIFLGLSMDEALSLHEKTMPALRKLFNADGVFYYPWVVPAIGFVIVLLLSYRKFLLALPSRTCRGILLAGGIYLSGTIGAEMLSGLWVSDHKMHNFTFGLLVAVEESLEMLGLVVFISVLLSLLRSIAGAVTFQFVKPESRESV